MEEIQASSGAVAYYQPYGIGSDGDNLRGHPPFGSTSNPRFRPDIFVLLNPILDRFETVRVEMPALRPVIFQWSEADPSFALVVLASTLPLLRTSEICIASLADLNPTHRRNLPQPINSSRLTQVPINGVIGRWNLPE